MHSAVIAVDLGQGVENAFEDVVAFIPRLLGFLLILVIGYFVVKAIAKVADAALDRVGFDRAVERGGIKQALSKSRYDASDILSKVIFYALFLLVLQLAFGIFGPNPVSDLISGVIAYLPRVVVAILIVVIFAAIAAGARTIIQSTLGGLSYGAALANVSAVAILVVGAFAALNQLAIAPAIVNGLFYALLAVIVGSTIVAVGGGGIQPMRSRWERALSRIEEEAPAARQQMRSRPRRPAPGPPPPSRPPASPDEAQDAPDDGYVEEVVVVEVEPQPAREQLIVPRSGPTGRRASGSRAPLRSRRSSSDGGDA
ncbi:MAG: hypothetical protein M3507_01165 [Actinomycetota bacterium]|nr:hypothetical protein [Actinomycetota bacterium]